VLYGAELRRGKRAAGVVRAVRVAGTATLGTTGEAVARVDVVGYRGGMARSEGRSVDAMGLNIKSEEAHRLARQLARLTGESMTAAVTEAVRERLDRLRREEAVGLADRLLAIGKDCAVRLKEPFRSANHGDLLYDERGLPRWSSTLPR
jgi:antitoxin VapB